MDTERTHSTLERLPILLIGILALILRFYQLGRDQFWDDELGQVVTAQGTWAQMFRGVAEHAGAAPLDYLITRFTLQVGDGEAILRAPAALLGVLTVLLVYWLSRELFGRLPALVTAFLLAILPMHVQFSQELRFYSLGTFGALATVAIFWLVQKRGAWWGWALYALALALFLYAHYYLIFVAAALALWTLLYRRDQLLPCLVATAAAALLFLPWLYYDSVVVSPRNLRLNPLNWTMPTDLATLLSSPFVLLMRGPQWPGIGDAGVWAFIALVWIGFAAAVVFVGTSLRRSEQRATLALPVLVYIVTTGGLLLLDIVGRYIFYHRQMLIALPFLLMASVAALHELAGRLSLQRAAVPLFAVFSLVAALILWPSLHYTYAIKESFATLPNVVSILEQNVREGDAILVGGPLANFQFYTRDLPFEMTEVPWTMEPMVEMIEEYAGESEVVWLVPWYGFNGVNMRTWGDENAWDVTPWLRGTAAQTPWDDGLPRVYVYSTKNPDAGLEIGRSLRLSPMLDAGGREYLMQSLSDQAARR